MSYRKNKQFLLASQRYYNACHETKHGDSCNCTDTCYKLEERDACYSKDACHKPEKCDPCHSKDAYHKPEKCDPCHSKDACHKPEKCDPCHCTDDCNREKCCDPCAHTKAEWCGCDVCQERNIPKTITDMLCNLISEQVDVTTPFGVVTGILLDVKRDYIIILENNGDQVLVRTEKIESVSPIT